MFLKSTYKDSIENVKTYTNDRKLQVTVFVIILWCIAPSIRYLLNYALWLINILMEASREIGVCSKSEFVFRKAQIAFKNWRMIFEN